MSRTAAGVLSFLLVLGLVGCSNSSPRSSESPTSSVAPEASMEAPSSGPAPELLGKHLEDVRVTTVEPNSAGGVEVKAEFRNASLKEMKYITFAVEPFNAVGDRVESRIGGKSTEWLRLTGPIAAGEERKARWDPVWYNATIVRLEVHGITIEYMDGTEVGLSGETLATSRSGAVTDVNASQQTQDYTREEQDFFAMMGMGSELIAEQAPELADVRAYELYEVAKTMCQHPDYDGKTWNDAARVPMPDEIPESGRLAIWVGTTLALCPR